MMSERQCAYFKSLYDEENARYGELLERGKLYLTIVTAYSGVFAFTTDGLFETVASNAMRICFAFLGASFIASLVCIVRSLGIYTYEGLSDPVEILKEMGAKRQSDDDFFDLRVADYAVAHNRNETQNNRRAAFLFAASWLMVIGILCHLLFVFHLFTNEAQT